MSQQPPDAQQTMESMEAIRALQRAIVKLPERSRLALILRWERKMSYIEIAESMAISVKGVEKALLTTAMRHLRKLMDETCRSYARRRKSRSHPFEARGEGVGILSARGSRRYGPGFRHRSPAPRMAHRSRMEAPPHQNRAAQALARRSADHAGSGRSSLDRSGALRRTACRSSSQCDRASARGINRSRGAPRDPIRRRHRDYPRRGQ